MQASISVKISDMDYDKAVSLMKDKINTENPLKKMAFGFIEILPAKKVFTRLLNMEIAKNKAMNSINSQFYEHGLDVNVYNFFLKEESTADIDVYCTIGDLSSFFEKLVKTQNEDLNSLAVSAIHNVFSEVPDAVKSKIINRLFKESNGEICRLLSDYISKKFFRIKIDSIDFHMSDI